MNNHTSLPTAFKRFCFHKQNVVCNKFYTIQIFKYFNLKVCLSLNINSPLLGNARFIGVLATLILPPGVYKLWLFLTNDHMLFFTPGSVSLCPQDKCSLHSAVTFSTTNLLKMLLLLSLKPQCCLLPGLSCAAHHHVWISRAPTVHFLLCDRGRELLSVWEKMVHRHWAQFQKSLLQMSWSFALMC